jgi:hypothetical protein
MRYDLYQVAMFAIAFVVPVVLGFGASELFKGMMYGGSAAFLGVLIYSLLFEGWQYGASIQSVLLNNLAVVPLSSLLAASGYMVKRMLAYLRHDQRAAG